MKIGFLKPDNTVDYMEYCEMEPYCMKEIKNYLDTETKRLDFESFCSEYSYFTPYFDYVIFKMHYILLRPFLMENYCGFGKQDRFCLATCHKLDYESIMQEVGAFYFLRSSDQNYNIGKSSVIENGMVDVNGMTLELFSEGDVDCNAWGHPGMSAMIINQYIMKYKEVYEDFVQYLDTGNPNIYVMFLIERLGFSQVTNRRSHGNVILNRHCCTKVQMQLAHAIQEYYGSNILPSDMDLKAKNHETQKKMIKLIWGDKIENRGF